MIDADLAAAIIQRCAGMYERNLANRRVLFIPSDGSAPFDCFFGPENFMHLCKVDYGDMPRRMFYRLAVDRRLDPKRLDSPNERDMWLKLEVLPTLCFIDSKASVAVRTPIADRRTRADLFCSGVNACMGFALERNGSYRPKTALKYNPPRDEPGYVNLIAAVKTEPHATMFTIVSKQPKQKAKTKTKHDLIVRALRSYPHPEAVTGLLDYPF